MKHKKFQLIFRNMKNGYSDKVVIPVTAMLSVLMLPLAHADIYARQRLERIIVVSSYMRDSFVTLQM